MFEFMKFKIPWNEIEPLEIRRANNFRERPPMLVVADGTIQCLIFGNIKFGLISK